MKKLLLLWLSLLPSVFLLAQNCLPSGIVFSTQSQIDNFTSNYPSCTFIEGNVIIGSNITNLDGLSNLASIAGNLKIQNNDNLTSLQGLQSLQAIGDTFLLTNNNNLTSLDGLQSLQSVGSHFHIQNNSSLSSLDALNDLQFIGSDFWLINNQNLLSINGLTSLFFIQGDLRISNNGMLSNLDGLANLQSIAGILLIQDNEQLDNIAALNSLQSIGADFSINNNDQLQSLNGLQNLQSVGGSFKISNNLSLAQINDLQSLQSIGDFLNIFNNENLSQIEGLSGLTSIPGYCNIEDNPNLTSLSGLQNIQNSGFAFNIKNNDNLQNLQGLDGLLSIGTNLSIANNDNLQNLSGLSNLQTVNGFFTIIANTNLQSLDGLETLQSIGTYIKIRENPSLNNLGGFQNLNTIGGELEIHENNALIHLNGLQNLQTINGDLDIKNNLLLNDISALLNLNTDGIVTLRITNNASLAACSQPFICQYLLDANPSDIQENAPGCNSANEVLNACQLNKVIGKVFFDLDQSCSLDPNEEGFDTWIIHATNGSSDYYTTTDTDGNYTLSLSPGSYTLNVIEPVHYWNACVQDVLADFTLPTDTIFADFPIQINIECPHLITDISTPLLRRCADNVYSLRYCNDGTTPAINAYIEVSFDEFFTINASSLPYTLVNGLLHFEVGDVSPGDCATITIETSLSCDALLGKSHCVSAHAYPDSFCVTTGQAYQGADLLLQSECNNGNLRFSITNAGHSDMPSTLDWVIIEDDIVMLNGNVEPMQINEDTILVIPATGATYRLEIEQLPGHPVAQKPSISLEACVANSTQPISLGYLTMYPQYESTHARSVDCQENVNAADPYIKDAYPKGYSDPHYIQANTDIDYIIRFQNTGLDTAHNILIVDTLSPHLDIASIRHGTSSHPYHMELEGDNVLRFSFDNIMLPDSSTNESASHGFVKFRIAQKPDTPSGTYLENAANIYFDYEAPAQTDTAWHNIAQDYMASNCLLSFHSQNDLTQFANSVLASPNMGCSLLIKTESDNDPITQLDALDVLTHIKGFVRIEQNDELQNLTGLHHIFLVDSFFNIGQNNSLTDLSGLENLNAIGGHLSIENNAALTSLHGLEQLTSISQRFDLHGNPYLSELSALENLYPDTLSELYVYLNDMLSTCTVPVICEYMHLVDSLYIASNASGCHTVDAVDMNCTVGIKPFNKDKLQVFPNPTDGTVRIVSPLSESVLLEVKDVSGKLLLQKGFTTETEINLSAFASGVYILMIQTKDTIWIERVVAN